MTGRNPNVFYETGYAHALNKQVILLTQNADDRVAFKVIHGGWPKGFSLYFEVALTH